MMIDALSVSAQCRIDALSVSAPVFIAPKSSSVSSQAVRQRIRGQMQQEMQSEVSKVYEYLGNQPSESLLPSLPDDMRKSRLAMALSVESAARAKEREFAFQNRMASRGKREIWRPDWESFLLADLLVVGGEIVTKQSIIQSAVVEFLKVTFRCL